MSSAKVRIRYFDLMKGVCIILVVLSHCYDAFGEQVTNIHLWSVLEHLRMPLYFFLSGMFFAEYSGIVELVVKKFNRLIVPFLCFSVLSVLPTMIVGDEPFDFFTLKNHVVWMLKYAGYLWFLRTLFVANILYYIYNKVVGRKSMAVKCAVLCAVVAIGWIVNAYLPQSDEWRRDYGILLTVVTSLMVFPFFFVASNIKPLLSRIENLSLWRVLLIALASIIVSVATAQGGVYLLYAKVGNGALGFYLSAFGAIFAVMCVCIMLRNICSRGYINYIGRYSIIVYLTHMPFITLMVKGGIISNLPVLALVTLAAMPVFVWVLKRLIPAFVAQRDIFIYSNSRVKVQWNAFSLKNR